MVFKAKVKCPFCGGEARLSKETLKFFGGVISLKDNPIYECSKCGEQFATGELVDYSLKEARKQFKLKRKIISTGGSLAITLPSDLSEFYRLKKGQSIQIIPESEKEMKIMVQ